MKNHLIAFILLSKSLANADDSETNKEMIKTLFHHNEPWVKIRLVHLKLNNRKRVICFQIEINEIEIIFRSFECWISRSFECWISSNGSSKVTRQHLCNPWIKNKFLVQNYWIKIQNLGKVTLWKAISSSVSSLLLPKRDGILEWFNCKGRSI